MEGVWPRGKPVEEDPLGQVVWNLLAAGMATAGMGGGSARTADCVDRAPADRRLR